jgi:hypothetical protein
MRAFAIILVLLGSCAAGTPLRSADPARLEFVSPATARHPGYIAKVDGHLAPEGPILVAPGAIRLEYQCADQVSVDALPSIVVGLESGVSYEMYCVNGKAHVRPKQ